MRARAFILIGAVLALSAPARAQFEVQAGLHVGFVFGRGFTVGPTLSAGRLITDTHLFSQAWSTFLAGGLAAAGDVSFGTGRPPTFRVYVGSELAALHTCPALVIPVGVGLVASFERAHPVTLGWGGNLTFLVAALHPTPDYLHPAPGPTFLVGPSYRVVSLGLASPAHEVGADVRFLFLPDGGGLGYCGGD